LQYILTFDLSISTSQGHDEVKVMRHNHDDVTVLAYDNWVKVITTTIIFDCKQRYFNQLTSDTAGTSDRQYKRGRVKHVTFSSIVTVTILYCWQNNAIDVRHGKKLLETECAFNFVLECVKRC